MSDSLRDASCFKKSELSPGSRRLCLAVDFVGAELGFEEDTRSSR